MVMGLASRKVWAPSCGATIASIVTVSIHTTYLRRQASHARPDTVPRSLTTTATTGLMHPRPLVASIARGNYYPLLPRMINRPRGLPWRIDATLPSGPGWELSRGPVGVDAKPTGRSASAMRAARPRLRAQRQWRETAGASSSKGAPGGGHLPQRRSHRAPSRRAVNLDRPRPGGAEESQRISRTGHPWRAYGPAQGNPWYGLALLGGPLGDHRCPVRRVLCPTI